MHTGGGGGKSPHFNFQSPKLQFQTSAILHLTDVQELYGPKVSQVLPCMLQFSDNIWRNFFNHIGVIDHFTFDLMKRSDINAEPSEKFLFVDNPKKDHNKREFKP